MDKSELAFPNQPHLHEGGLDSYWTMHPATGMTLRDWFAGMAMGSGEYALNPNPEHVAWTAYKIADAMLKERDKPENT